MVLQLIKVSRIVNQQKAQVMVQIDLHLLKSQNQKNQKPDQATSRLDNNQDDQDNQYRLDLF